MAELAATIFNNRPLADGAGLIAIEMPVRDEDAAIVPMTVRATLPPGDTRRVKAFTVVIDEIPCPSPRSLNRTECGRVVDLDPCARRLLHERARGRRAHRRQALCGRDLRESLRRLFGPGGKTADKTGIGQMRLRQFAKSPDAVASNLREAQIMIRHPNNSGLQMDQITRHYLPAYFVQSLKIWQGEELLLTVESSISISEDPNFRFTYLPSNAKSFAVEATDTDNRIFKGDWPVDASQI